MFRNLLKLFSIMIVFFILFNVFSINSKDVKKIGIMQYIQNESLDRARQGFIDGLKDLGYEDGKNMEINYFNASGEIANTLTIASEFNANKNYDLFLAIATPAAQSLAKKVSDRPILITAITDPELAELVKSNKKSGTNVGGTSDKVEEKKQVELLKKLFPNIKRVGILYCETENNSIYTVERVKEELKKVNIDYEIATVQTANDVIAVTQSIVDDVDAIFMPTDSVIATSVAAITKIANSKGVITMGSEPQFVEEGALFMLGIDYYDLGVQTSKIAFDVIENGKDISQMEIEYAKKLYVKFNEKTAKQLGLDIDRMKKVANE